MTTASPALAAFLADCRALRAEQQDLELAQIRADQQMAQATLIALIQSDLDLAVLGDKPVDLVKVTNEVIKSLHLNEVDVVDLRRASPLLAMEIVHVPAYRVGAHGA